MSVLALVTKLKQLQVVLKLVDGKLRVQAPPGVLSDNLKAQMRDYKQELIQSLERAQTLQTKTDKSIEAVDRTQDLPLSFAQQRMWVLHQIEPNNTAYNMSSAMLLTGDVNIEALKRAINGLQCRHEILRTCYQLKANAPDAQPRQIIKQTSDVSVSVHDAHNTDNTDRVTVENLPEPVRQWLMEQVNTPFDLAQDSVLRVQMVKLSARQMILQWVVHHIAVDAWSMSIISQDFALLYRFALENANADAQTLAARLPAQKLQYADFAKWQRDWLAEEQLQQQLDYWRKTLGSQQPVLELPMTGARQAQRSGTAGRFHFRLPPELSDAIARLNNNTDKSRHVSPYVLLLAGLQRLLKDYSGQQDIRVGVPAASRHNPQIQSLVGCFINPLVMKAEFNAKQTVWEFIAQCQQRSVEAQDYQDIPFEMLVDELVSNRDMGISPLFQVMFNYLQNDASQNLQQGANDQSPDNKNSTGQLRIEPVTLNPQPAKYDLSLMVQARRGTGKAEPEMAFNCTFEYDPGLFNKTFIEAISGYYQRLLTGMTSALLAGENPPLATIKGCPEQQLQQQLLCWNDTSAQVPEDAIETLFSAQAEQQGEGIAALFSGQSISYAQLASRSNQLAHLLQAKGVGPGVMVGICQKRSLALLISLLAVQKAGAAYVPLDPTYPEARIHYMLEDADLSLLLCDQAVLDSHLLSGHLLSGVKTPVVNLDDSASWSMQSDTLPDHEASGDDLAYMIYTSGSTGRPKAVEVTRANLSHFIFAMQQVLKLTPQDRLLAVTSLSFDIAVLELYLPLVSGASVLLGDEELAMDGERLCSMLDLDVSIMQATPVTWKLLLASGWHFAPDKGTKREFTALCGGEAFPVDLAHKLLDLPIRVWNMYGPTETTVWSTMCELSKAAITNRVPIGRPVANTQCYVLDDEMQLLPVGAPGELYIGGQGVTRGYRGRDELTAERFIDTQYGGLYRTGDLARYRDDGVLECLGRMDNQVKVRGYRIELGEIEAALMRQPGVADVAVQPNECAGETVLVAYLVADAGVDAQTSSQWPQQLRDAIAQNLPGYMVPAIFIQLDALPLTPNGKLDRKALPAPDIESQQQEYVAPETETEKLLCELLQSALGVAQVGLLDNFFQLGGHSLLATRLVARLNQRLAISLPLKAVFTTDNIKQLAREVDQAQASRLPPLVAVSREQTLPLSFAQQRLWLLDQIEQGGGRYIIAGAIQLEGKLNTEALNNAFAEIVQRHESLRTCFAEARDGQNNHGQLTQVILSGKKFSVSHIQANDDQAEIKRILTEFASRRFDLSQDLMLRVQLVTIEEGSYVLQVVMHHIASDGWSLPILMNEFCALYAAYLQGQTSPLAPLPLQYADYAYWQRSWLQGEELERQLGYWRKQLANLPVVHSLPLDRARPEVQTFSGDVWNSHISAADIDNLRHQCQRANATLFMGLHAVLSVLMARYSGEKDIVMGSPIANREQADVAGLIGFFVNMLVLRTDLTGTPDFAEVIRRSRACLLQAYSYQQVPFEELVEQLQPVRTLRHSPLFQIMIAFRNKEQMPDNIAKGDALNGLKAQFMPVDEPTAKYDLTLWISEKSDGVDIAWEYNTDLFLASRIARMAEHFEQLLAALLAEPTSGVFSVPMLVSEEKQLLNQWNATHLSLPQQGVELLFSEVAAQQADRTAVLFAEQSLSYAQLHKLSNQLAHLLQSKGVKPGQMVGICQQRSLNLVISVMAVLKAGAAYVPLDPNYPIERIHFMLNDACMALILSDESVLQGDVLSGTDIPVVNVSESESLRTFSDSLPNHSAVAGDLAYMIYTSGSTGRPKGVEVTRGNVTNFIFAMRKLLKPVKEDRLLALASLSFDMATLELLLPLTSGAELVLGDERLGMDGDRLRSVLDSGITIMQATPVTWKLALAAGWRAEQADAVSNHRFTALCGGEAFPVELAHSLLDLPIQVWNMYGPTETTVWSSGCQLSKDLVTNTVPIGKPVANTQLYVFDSQRQVLPVGVAGELYIGGAGVTQGYWRRPELSAERFIDSDYGRLYRTGDVARYRENGVLECLGRVDNQVKVRGYRIEPDEIEHALLRHQAVVDGVVQPKEVGGEAILVAYVITQSGFDEEQQEHLIASLRATLTRQLPGYMVPAIFQILEALPLTPNGKVDRKALPDPDGQQVVNREYVAPVTAMQRTLCELWQEIFQLEQVSIDDNFFELGGHSLLVMHLVARLRKMGIQSKVRLLFETPVLKELARSLEALHNPNPAQYADVHPRDVMDVREGQLIRLLIPHSDKTVAKPLFCLHHGGGHTRQYSAIAERLAGVVPVYGLQSRILYEPDYTENDINEVAREFADRIQSVQASGPYRLLGWSLGGVLSVAVTRVLESRGESVSFLGLLDSHLQTQACEREKDLVNTVLRVFGEDAAQKYTGIPLSVRQAFEEKIIALDDNEALDYASTWVVDIGLTDADSFDPDFLRVRYRMALHASSLSASFTSCQLQASAHLWWASAMPDGDSPPQTWHQCCDSIVHESLVSGGHDDVVFDAEMIETVAAVVMADCDVEIAAVTDTVATENIKANRLMEEI